MKRILFLACCILLSCSSKNARELMSEKGGLILQVTINYKEFIRGELTNPDQELIQHTLSFVKEFKGTPEEFVKKFMDSFEKMYPKRKIVQYMKFGSKGGLTIASSNNEVREHLITKLNEYIELDKATMISRIELIGTHAGEVTMKDHGILEVIAPAVMSYQRATDIISFGGVLNFYENYEFSEIPELWNKVQQRIDSLDYPDLTVDQRNTQNQYRRKDHLVVSEHSLYEVQSYIETLKESGDLPTELSFILEVAGDNEQTHGFFLRPCKIPKNQESPIQGRDIVSSIAEINENGQALVNLTLTDDGAEKWEDWTRKHVGKTISIVWENTSLSSPKIIQPIAGNVTQITGNFTKKEVTSLAALISRSNLLLTYSIVKVDLVPAKKI